MIPKYKKVLKSNWRRYFKTGDQKHFSEKVILKLVIEWWRGAAHSKVWGKAFQAGYLMQRPPRREWASEVEEQKEGQLRLERASKGMLGYKIYSFTSISSTYQEPYCVPDTEGMEVNNTDQILSHMKLSFQWNLWWDLRRGRG